MWNTTPDFQVDESSLLRHEVVRRGGLRWVGDSPRELATSPWSPSATRPGWSAESSCHSSSSCCCCCRWNWHSQEVILRSKNCLLFTAVFFNLFQIAEPLERNWSFFGTTTFLKIVIAFLGKPVNNWRGTFGFYGSWIEKHWSSDCNLEIRVMLEW